MNTRKSVLFIVLLTARAFAQGPQTFIAVHLEPTHTGYYQSLVKMVALADSFHAPLTLEFNPQWADTILSVPALLSQVRGWQKQGHEIAAHHHDVGYGANGWDGFTNRPQADYPVLFKYRGNMQEYHALLSRLAGDSLLLTGCIGDPEVDWPAGIIYRTEGHNIEECVSRPVEMTLNGQKVTSVGFGLINTPERVDSAKAAFNFAGPKDVLGVVLHETNFAANPANLRSWLEFLRDRGKTVKTVTRILREYAEISAVDGNRQAGSLSPYRVELQPAYPNPFNGSSTIRFILNRAGRVVLELADVRGRTVRTVIDGNMDAGAHAVRITDDGLPSGVYIAILKADGAVLSRKIALMR